jgi:hypothetical protein
MHQIWYKFAKFLQRKFGQDYHRNLHGYAAIKRIESYAVNNPEIKIIRVDDAIYAGSILVLVPHPKHGITVLFIPQLAPEQNQFFLYETHLDGLMEALTEMKYVYNKINENQDTKH